jgi:hypothetical protein
MYTLLRRIPNGIDGMLNEFESFVTTTGRQTMSSLEDLVCRAVRNRRDKLAECRT